MDYFYNLFKPKTVAWTLGKSDTVVTIPVNVFVTEWRNGKNDRLHKRNDTTDIYREKVDYYLDRICGESDLALAQIRLSAYENDLERLDGICPYYTTTKD